MSAAEQGNRRSGAFLTACAVAAVLCVIRVTYASPFAFSWDAVDFALALDRFDLLAMQPHFPGYPYFVLFAMLLRPVVGDPVLALSAASAIAYVSAVLPMYRLVRATLSPWPAALTVIAMQGAAYMWVIASQPMSEGMAVAALWWYLWSLQAALHSDRLAIRLAPALTFGLLIGVRLSYVPFGAGLLFLLWKEWKRKRRAGFFALGALIVFSQLLWIGALVTTEGSISGFVQLSLEFVRGHFTEWGGAASVDTGGSITVRFIRLIVYNFLWTGLLGGSLWNAVVLGVSLAIAAVAMTPSVVRESIRFSAKRGILIASLFALYFLWALFAQNIDKPRHIAPLIGPLLWLLAIMLHAASANRNKALRILVKTSALLAIAVQLAVGASLLMEQRNELPPTYKLHNFLEHLDEDFIVYTWEETRVLQYLRADYSHRRIRTYELFLQEVDSRPVDDTVFITDAVADGFASQGADIEEHLVAVARFTGNKVLEPVYHDIRLYEWIR